MYITGKIEEVNQFLQDVVCSTDGTETVQDFTDQYRNSIGLQNLIAELYPSINIKIPKEVKFEEMPEYGDKMTLDSWLECVESGSFIDYDGHGNLATPYEMSNIRVWPSLHMDGKLERPNWATHVIWFNK